MTGLTSKDYAYLILLKMAGREIDNKEMEELYGIRLVSPDYERLNSDGYVESTTPRGRAYRHRLSPKGEKLLDGDLVIDSNKKDPLARVLPLLHDLYRKAPTAPTVTGRIRAAYADLSATHGDWVRLADLRDSLADVPRADLDRALKALHRESDVRLEPEPHRHRIGPADRDAALTIGGEERHKLAIGMP